MNILLISGHGAGDPGAVGNGYREADEARKVTAALKTALDGYQGVTSALYPTDRNAYEDYKSGSLATVAQFQKYDYVLEVHFNAFQAGAADGKSKGVECYVTTTESGTTVEEAICRRVSAVGLTDRGVKRYNWSVIARAKQAGVSSALLEVCFIDDPDDMAVYKAKFGLIVAAIADGIAEGFGLKKKPATPAAPAPTTPDKTEDDTMTYEQFKKFMQQYEAEKAAQQPDAWSAAAREWAEANGYIKGDQAGQKRYKSNVTREELAQVLYNIHK